VEESGPTPCRRTISKICNPGNQKSCGSSLRITGKKKGYYMELTLPDNLHGGEGATSPKVPPSVRNHFGEVLEGYVGRRGRRRGAGWVDICPRPKRPEGQQSVSLFGRPCHMIHAVTILLPSATPAAEDWKLGGLVKLQFPCLLYAASLASSRTGKR
jgi:hypothetical protein